MTVVEMSHRLQQHANHMAEDPRLRRIQVVREVYAQDNRIGLALRFEHEAALHAYDLGDVATRLSTVLGWGPAYVSLLTYDQVFDFFGALIYWKIPEAEHGETGLSPVPVLA